MPEAISFKQGRTFSLIISLEESVPIGQYREFTAIAQMRRFSNRTPAGFLASLSVTPLDPDTTNAYLLYFEDTTDWPVGLIELDLHFENSEGFVFYSETLTFNVERVVTRKQEAI